jgi:hypothetical protein
MFGHRTNLEAEHDYVIQPVLLARFDRRKETRPDLVAINLNDHVAPAHGR